MFDIVVLLLHNHQIHNLDHNNQMEINMVHQSYNTFHNLYNIYQPYQNIQYNHMHYINHNDNNLMHNTVLSYFHQQHHHNNSTWFLFLCLLCFDWRLYIYICTSRLSFDATSRYGSCRFQTNSCLGSHFSTRSVFVRCESLCHHGRYQHRTVARVKIVASSGSIDSVLVMADFEMLPFWSLPKITTARLRQESQWHRFQRLFTSKPCNTQSQPIINC